MERIVLICPQGELQPEMLNHVMPFNFQKMYMPEERVEEPKKSIEHPSREPEISKEHDEHIALTKSSLQDMEKEAIIKALIENRGIQTKAAKQLGMSARQIGYKIKKYDIEL
jgi:Nif-specific regulatory protein